MNLTIRFIAEPDQDGGFNARAIGHSIFTQAESVDELRRQAEEAVLCHVGDRSSVSTSVEIQWATISRPPA